MLINRKSVFICAFMYLFNNYGWYGGAVVGTTVPKAVCLAPVPVWVPSRSPYGSLDSLQPLTVALQNFCPHPTFLDIYSAFFRGNWTI